MSTVNEVYAVGHPRTVKYATATECVNPSQVIGLELEVENCESFSGTQWGSIANKHHFGVKTDGSLRGVAYEFVSLPMRSEHALSALGNFLKDAGLNDSNYSDRCSVHIHANCSDMEMEQVATLALLYTVMEEVLFEFIGHNRDSNIFCIPWSQCRAHLNLVNSFLREPGAVMKRWSKYTALNLIPLSNLGTVEFRQMHGTADMTKLTTWINIIGALFNQAKTVPLKDLIAEIKTLNSTSQYEQFFNKTIASQLPYSDAYREKLEAGVIFAKYSLISMEGKRRTPRAKAVPEARTVTLETVGLYNEELARARADIAARAATVRGTIDWAAVAQVAEGRRGVVGGWATIPTEQAAPTDFGEF